jgi:ADP-ribosylation factor GTPase-activating protein 2/3
VEGIEAAVAPKVETEDDFFTSWSKPNTPKSSQPSTPRVSTPPIIGFTPSANSTMNQPASSASVTAPAPRTISSSARIGASASRLNSASSVGTTSTVKKSKLGLGASKTKPVDFAEAERRAREEEEKIKQLGYDREREEREERVKKDADALKLSLDLNSKVSIGSTNVVTTSNHKLTASTPDPKKSAAFPRLGFGAIPGAGASVAVSATTPKTTTVADDAPTTAREKFGNQRAISSDMFFGRGNYDADQLHEAQTRLQTFQGATSISSNQYFGREEEEGLPRDDHDGGLLGDGSLTGLESAAKDAFAKVLANPDVQNLGENIRVGALKVSSTGFLLLANTDAIS